MQNNVYINFIIFREIAQYYSDILHIQVEFKEVIKLSGLDFSHLKP